MLWNHYRDLELPFEVIAMPDYGMRVRWTLDQFFGFIETFSATRRCVEAHGRAFIERAYEALAPLWGDPDTRRAIPLDFVLYAGRKIG